VCSANCSGHQAKYGNNSDKTRAEHRRNSNSPDTNRLPVSLASVCVRVVMGGGVVLFDLASLQPVAPFASRPAHLGSAAYDRGNDSRRSIALCNHRCSSFRRCSRFDVSCATMDRYWSASAALLAGQGAARRRTSGRVLAEPNDRHRYTTARSKAAHRASQFVTREGR
jgi:hypothetical protein